MYRYNIAIVFAYTLWDVTAAQKDCRPKDCYDLKCYGVSKAKDGPHTIYSSTTGLDSFRVSCDQETEGGGWIMYQRRVDGTVDFTRNWEAYKYGFGDHGGNTTELWFGNENVYQMLMGYGSTKWELRIEADAFDGTDCWVMASNLHMYYEGRRYAMYWDSVSASKAELVDDLNYHKLKPFNTLDNSEGINAKRCLIEYKGGWWYDNCGKIFLNGEYENKAVEFSTSIYVSNFKQQVSLERSRMMFRPQNDVRPCNNPCKNGGTCEFNEATNSAKCRCIAEFSGSTCEGTDNDTHNDTDSEADSETGNDAFTVADIETHNDTGSDADSVADSDTDSVADSDADSDADSVADSGADSDAHSDVHSDADSGADSGAHSDVDSGAYNGADSDADSGDYNGPGSKAGSALPAVVGVVLLLVVLIAGAIVVGEIRRRKQRETEFNGPTCEDADSDADSDTGNSSRSDTTPETA